MTGSTPRGRVEQEGRRRLRRSVRSLPPATGIAVAMVVPRGPPQTMATMPRRPSGVFQGQPIRFLLRGSCLAVERAPKRVSRAAQVSPRWSDRWSRSCRLSRCVLPLEGSLVGQCRANVGGDVGARPFARMRSVETHGVGSGLAVGPRRFRRLGAPEWTRSGPGARSFRYTRVRGRVSS